MTRRNEVLVAFPLARNVKVIDYFVAKYLELPGGPGSLRYFRRSVLGELARKRRALGFPAATVNAEMKEIEHAIAQRLAARRKQEGAA
jgi:hypothetical protein